MELDANLLEINPLILTEENEFVALDAKMTFDDNALYRHKNVAELQDIYEEDPVREDYRHLHKHVNTLIPKYRELLRLRYWLHMSFREIANTLHIKESTAKVWHHRAVQKLRSTVEKYD